MEKCKKFIKKNKIIYGIISLISLAVTVATYTMFFVSDFVPAYMFVAIFFSAIFIFGLALFISSFYIKLQDFDHQSMKITVYCGFEHHYLFVDGKLVDEFNCSFTFNNIVLKYKSPYGNIEAIISIDNSINVSVDGERVLRKI